MGMMPGLAFANFFRMQLMRCANMKTRYFAARGNWRARNSTHKAQMLCCVSNAMRGGVPTQIIITDRGIGMTPEVVRDYFLKAGASFRRNQLWREEHEDSAGHSRVYRSGRFGVGALAAFLLGDEIEVTSRHAFLGASGGISFTAKLDDETISLNRIECPVGTQIKINVPAIDATRDRIKRILPTKRQKIINYASGIGHYFLKQPSLIREITGYPEIPLEGFLPLPNDDVSPHWRWFKTREFERVFWTYLDSYPSLSCNGIVISPRKSDAKLESKLRMPNISVYDKDGLLPVNLQRDGLQSEIPFKPELLESISDDLVVYALLEAPENSKDNWFYDGGYEGFSKQAYDYYYAPKWSQWFLSRDGFILNSSNLIAEFKPESLVVVIGGPKGFDEAIRGMLTSDALACSCLPDAFASDDVRMKGAFLFAINGNFVPDSVSVESYTVYIPDCVVKKIESLRPGKAVRRGLERLSKNISSAGWKAFPAGGLGDDGIFPGVASLSVDPNNPAIICVYRTKKRDISEKNDVMAKRWMELLGTPLISFKIADRKQLKRKMRERFPELMQVRETLKRKESKLKKRDDRQDDDL
jgi:molecular chaperone HtpG